MLSHQIYRSFGQRPKCQTELRSFGQRSFSDVPNYTSCIHDTLKSDLCSEPICIQTLFFPDNTLWMTNLCLNHWYEKWKCNKTNLWCSDLILTIKSTNEQMSEWLRSMQYLLILMMTLLIQVFIFWKSKMDILAQWFNI